MLKRIVVLLVAVMCLNLSGCVTQAILAAAEMARQANTQAYIDRGTKLQASQTYGTKIDPVVVSKIKNGVTTRAEIEALFGPSQHVALTGDGGRMMLYNYYSASEKSSLQIFLNEKNVVKDHEYSH